MEKGFRNKQSSLRHSLDYGACRGVIVFGVEQKLVISIELQIILKLTYLAGPYVWFLAAYDGLSE